MNRLLLQLFCIVNLISLHHAVEFKVVDSSNKQVYDIKGLISEILSRLHISYGLNEDSTNLIDDLKFNGLNLDTELRELGDLWQNSSKCARDILYTLFNIKNQWALNLIDSFGKPESGILRGNSKWIGEYNECLGVRSTNPNSTVGNFRGRYCYLQWSLPASVVKVVNTSFPLPFITGMCVPDSCSAAQLQSVIQLFHIAGSVPSLNATAPAFQASITCKPRERPLNTPAKVVIALLSVFCTLAVLGSSVTAVRYFKEIIKPEPRRPSLVVVNVTEDGHHVVADGKSSAEEDHSLIRDINASSKKEPGKLETFLSCFCVFTNGAKLLNIDSTEGQLLCIHGIRFLSMSWVILWQAYLTYFNQTRNSLEAIKLLDNFPFEVVVQSSFSVDSFFVLSGFLLSYSIMEEFAKTKGVISWTYFYFDRYISLTPFYVIVLGFSATVYLFLGSGPFWTDNDVDPMCRNYWWRNFLYINNLFKWSEQCMNWSWFLAIEMQYFIISPLFLITWWRWPKIGHGLVGAFLCTCWLSSFFITYHFEVFGKSLDYMDEISSKPHTRIAPYLIGMLTGYFLFKHKASKRPKYNWVLLCIGWIIATTITLACVYGAYHSRMSLVATSFYNALSRTGFAVGLSWVIFVCLIGQGGFVNAILSYKLFIPLSRLNFAVYMIHPMIVNGYFESLKATFEYSHPTMVLLYLGFMLVTYGLSVPIALVLQYPFWPLEKIVRKCFSRKESS